MRFGAKALGCAAILAGLLCSGSAGAFEVKAMPVAKGLIAPLALEEANDGTGRLFVLEQIGRIRIITRDGELLEQPFLDFMDRLDPTIEPGFDERGALGLALHPEFAENGKLYVYYSAPLREGHDLEIEPGWGSHTSHIVELKMSDENPDLADPDYERMLLQVDQPQFAHNAGGLAFGPEGKLFIALGDGGSAPENEGFPIEGTSQMPGSLLGKILRVDVDVESDAAEADGRPYGIPEDNPFVGEDGYRGEIYAMGFRNPYRIAFDRDGSGRLVVGDVGQNSYEEIDLVEAGGNYGWAVKEGTHCFNWDDIEAHFDSCADEGMIDPIVEYRNGGKFTDSSEGRSTVGGVFYRGEALPELQGKLLFADWGKEGGEPSGIIYVGEPSDDPSALWSFEPLRIEGFEHFILSLAQGQDNEIYVLAHGAPGPEGDSGSVFKLGPSS